ETTDSTVDPHEPCLNGRCQSLWLNFQGAPWGRADAGPARASRIVFDPGASVSERAPRASLSYDNAPLRGATGATIVIIEFTDFACPYCRRSEAALKEVLAKYGGRVALAHLDFPLEQVHAESEQASEAARCAGDLG